MSSHDEQAVLDPMNNVTLRPEAQAVLVHAGYPRSGSGFTANVLLDAFLRAENLFAHSHDGRDPLSRSTATRCVSSCRTCTSGRASSGCAAWSSWRRIAPAFGSATATTCAATRGTRSAIRHGGKRAVGDQQSAGVRHVLAEQA